MSVDISPEAVANAAAYLEDTHPHTAAMLRALSARCAELEKLIRDADESLEVVEGISLAYCLKFCEKAESLAVLSAMSTEAVGVGK